MKNILNELLEGKISLDEAENQLKITQIQEMGNNVKFDKTRQLRVGVPEAVYSQGKTDNDLINTINNVEIDGNLMVTRLPEERFNRISNKLSKDVLENGTYYEESGVLAINKKEIPKRRGKVGIITAGTADVPIADEARITVNQSGFEAICTYDVGIAGIHRLMDKITYLMDEDVDVIIALAGMEGALPSVVAGLVDIPVVAVPTSTGYGVGEKGFAALFAMLQSCAPGIATMNIDNGYGAGVYAVAILNRIERKLK